MNKNPSTVAAELATCVLACDLLSDAFGDIPALEESCTCGSVRETLGDRREEKVELVVAEELEVEEQEYPF